MDSLELFVRFVSQYAHVDDDNAPFEMGQPEDALRLLWPILASFQTPEGRELTALPYDARFEADVDAMIERLATEPSDTYELDEPLAARVLLERIKQAMMVLGSNKAASRRVMVPLTHLPEAVREVAAVIQWLYRMTLPFEPGSTFPPMRERH